jgi:SAM-dependent methyltransferase
MPAVSALLVRLFNEAVRPLLVAIRMAADGLLERVFGVATRGEVQLDRLGLQSQDRRDYKPAPWRTLAMVLRRTDVDGATDVFIDFGAGKGRVVFLAARYPFKRVIGVELSPDLSRLARENIERHRNRLRCADVEIVTSDVLDYEIPDDVTIAFFYNPFGGDVFVRVLSRLLASVDRRPRFLRIIYHNPVEHETLMATGRVRLLRRTRGWRPTPAWSRSNSTHVYEVTTPSG